MLDYIYGIVRRVRWVLAAGFLAAVLTAIVALCLPSWYVAHTSFLPAVKESSTGSVTAFLHGVLNPGGGLNQTLQAGDLSVSLMRSRRIRAPLAEEFDLQERYGQPDIDATIRELDGHVSFFVGQEGMVTVTVEDREPEVAAAIANRMVALLDTFNSEQRMTRGRGSRIFIEGQLARTMDDLRQAEEALETYQAETKVVPLSPDVQAAVGTGAGLMARKLQLEIELEVKQQWLTDRSEELRRLRSELAGVESHLGALPALTLEFARRVRDVRVHEELYAFLRTQYAEAKIREQEDTPTLDIVDRATPLALRARPRRALMVMTAAVVTALLAVFAAMAATYVELLPATSRRRQVLAATGSELGRLVRPGRRR